MDYGKSDILHPVNSIEGDMPVVGEAEKQILWSACRINNGNNKYSRFKISASVARQFTAVDMV